MRDPPAIVPSDLQRLHHSDQTAAVPLFTYIAVEYEWAVFRMPFSLPTLIPRQLVMFPLGQNLTV